MALNQTRLTHYTARKSDVINEETWECYLTLRRLGRCIKGLKSICSQHIHPSEDLRDQFTELAVSNNRQFRTWVKRVDSGMLFEVGSISEGDKKTNTGEFWLSPSWQKGYVEVGQTQSKVRVGRETKETFWSPPTTVWRFDRDIDIFTRDLECCAHEWLHQCQENHRAFLDHL